MQGRKWTHIKLADPMVNPVMEEPVRRLLGLKVRELKDVIAGREVNGIRGGEGIRQALSKIDIDERIEHYRQEVKGSRGARRDNAVKSLRYLVSAKKQKLNPSDWVIDKVPVIPPIFRPISQVGNVLRASDMNELYKDLIESNNGIKSLRKDLPDEALADEKLQAYKALHAVVGLGEPITPEGVSKRWKGAIRQVIGSSPKTGLFQSKVLSKTVDVVGRGVVAPDPALDMDSVGIPEDKAWTLYRPFVIRRLVRRGFPPARAAELVENRGKEAEEMLLQEMQDRPVLLDRAPTWHKFNLLAFKPHLVKEDVIRVSPLIVSGFNMDFDGDTANFHVPVSDKAVKQARERMMPSKNLFAVKDLKSPQHAPSKEMLMGLYQLTRDAEDKPPLVFATAKEAKKAYREGLIGPNDPIVIQEAG
jgi:DNA-directed RNA polymerase subunit beta'